MFHGLLGRRVILNLESGESFSGRVLSLSRHVVRLQDAAVLAPQEGPLEGVVRVPRARIVWIQEV
jgi:hypothetical protein